jgi:4-hydroxy-L-threonine phosphate dehydrogenase PdxA
MGAPMSQNAPDHGTALILVIMNAAIMTAMMENVSWLMLMNALTTVLV